MGAASRTQGYSKYEAAVQLPIFKHLKNLDPRAELDGNAILLDKLADERFGKVVEHDLLHLSCYRNCQRIVL